MTVETNIFSVDDLILTPEQQQAVSILMESAKQLVLQAFRDDNSPASASSLAKDIYGLLDTVTVKRLNSGPALACRVGCAWCCYLRVKLTPLEVLWIYDDLTSRLDAGALSDMYQRVAAIDEVTRGMDGHQRVKQKVLCPLNVDGVCLVYPVRPVRCRLYHALEESDCRLSLDDPNRRFKIRADISALGLGIQAGLTAGLLAAELRSSPLELVAGLRMVMDEPARVNRWLTARNQNRRKASA